MKKSTAVGLVLVSSLAITTTGCNVKKHTNVETDQMFHGYTNSLDTVQGFNYKRSYIRSNTNHFLYRQMYYMNRRGDFYNEGRFAEAPRIITRVGTSHFSSSHFASVGTPHATFSRGGFGASGHSFGGAQA